MVWRAAFLAGCLALGAGARADALELSLPSGATLTGETREEAASYRVPTGGYADGRIPAIEAEGVFVQQAWRLDAPGLTSLQLQRPLRTQIVEAGYEILLDCAAQECGGFDFRFNTEVLPAPGMFVDLMDYRFLSARKEGADGTADFVSVLVSRVSGSGYIQIIRVAQSAGAALDLTVRPDAPAVPAGAVVDPGTPETPLAEQLVQTGHVVLSDLDFETGTVSLGQGPHASLQALAAFLREDSARRVALVGHTDTVGTLENNVALSRRRAAAVLERLVSEYDIPRTQLEAEGMGYLSPVASNLTPEGREANRRVEAVLLNAE